MSSFSRSLLVGALLVTGCSGPSPLENAGTSSGSGGSGAGAGSAGSSSGSGTGGEPAGGSSTGGSSRGGSSAGVGGSASVGGSGTAGGGSTGTGGSAGIGGSSAGSPSGDGFTLLFRDDFDELHPTRWQLMTHSWAENLALFSAQAVTVAEGNLTVTLLPAPQGTVDGTGAPKSFLGAEVRSTDTLTYGRVRARVKFASGSAVVSSLVTIYTPWPADNWNELDVECLGTDPENVQFNAMVYTGAPVQPPVTSSVTPTQDPLKVALGFDPSAAFHVFEIAWTPAGATFSVDDAVLRTWTAHIELMTLPQNVLLTIWASSSAAWAGPVTEATAGASATYDWIELYRWEP